LEEKLKTYDESSITSSESMTDLRREVTRYRDTESYSAKYIADLEARLSRSDESVLALQQTLENLEKECERRRNEVEDLQSRLQLLKQDGDSWRTVLEERERKVGELEKKMAEWEQKRKEADEERQKLGAVVGEVMLARKSFENLEVNGTNPSSGVSTPNPDSLENQFIALRQTHTATLADLSNVSAKYRDALREISDLAGQMQEAKLSGTIAVESPTTERLVEIPPFRRKRTGIRTRELSEPQLSSSGRRPFFRQAASAESLHAR
jgi:DNA repair exonuclease SbcCD ATPase subunit